ncbi:GNAT family N-acetyltransferase [Streptomyces spiramenti]|uniref:GNAT family N-acetyltransferase n=1 Tax=Streptomyces spiramenti TaxID=2720606 RepID=A0ABX1ARK1_9ACTN|nr:GNAT family N-acetyltransferase [Streptomyces spiramenti]NJP66890.1 GNAT family N-acetyltransferase [Streptomyces spiramenti]
MGMSVMIGTATESDTEHVLKLQYLCYQSEAELYSDYSLEPLTQSLEELRTEMAGGPVLVARLGSEVVGAVRGRIEADGAATIGTLMVHPRMRRHGLGRRLLAAMEELLAGQSATADRFRLRTGHRSEGNLRLYRRLGYAPVGTEVVTRRLSVVTLEKRRATPSPVPELAVAG